jgi:S-adenosyl-L-methionine hydrolase (adenosine-forming)
MSHLLVPGTARMPSDTLPRPILTLTSDFGSHGSYVAAMKGVVLSAVPDAHLVDVSHSISPQSVVEAAFVLTGLVDAFPTGTVHLAVVDPGVGTARRLIAALMAGHWFVAPDNGLLSYVARDHDPTEVFEIENPMVRRPRVSNTFHGRDILAPAAAHLLLGRPASELGPPRHGILTLPAIEPRREGVDLLGEVIFRDSFGNLITNVPGDWIGGVPLDSWRVEINGHETAAICRTYADHPPGTLVALVGSQGHLEISIVQGDASRYLNAGQGTTVWFRRR